MRRPEVDKLIIEYLKNNPGHYSSQEICNEIQRVSQKTNPSTVYRGLERLVSAGLVSISDFGRGSNVYELSESKSHHHLICQRCKTSIELEGKAFDPALKQVGSETGYKMLTHHLVVFGICPNCQRILANTESMSFPDFVKSGNLAVDPSLYEKENEAIDHEGKLWRVLETLAPWSDKTLLDLGCGSGYWLTKYKGCHDLIGVEPDSDLLPLAEERGCGRVLSGSAEHIPLSDASVDIVHARFAYFFPSERYDCKKGLQEVSRVLKPSGSLLVIDNDHEWGEFASLLKQSPWACSQEECKYINEWWLSKGARRHAVASSWRFENRADYEAVLRLEFPAEVVDPWLEAHPRKTSLSYGYLVWEWIKH